MKSKILLVVGLLCLQMCMINAQNTARIVSLNGTVSEILCQLGLESQIVGVDVTSTYPSTLRALPNVGHNENISAEGVLTLNPSMIIGTTNYLNPSLIEQFKAAHVEVVLVEQEYSVEGTKKLIQEVAIAVNMAEAVDKMTENLDAQLARIKPRKIKPKVLFVYARGQEILMVAGKNTPFDKIIELSGGINAAADINYLKPLTPESLVASNPDVILMFDKGLRSMDGVDGLLRVKGMDLTNAGRSKTIVHMDGQYLVGFGPRLGEAVLELSQKLPAL